MTHYIPMGRHGILVPRYKDLHGTLGVTCSLAGHFTLITHSPRYGSRVRAEFDNLILDRGLDRMGQGGFVTAVQIGTGNTPPATNQTSLAAYLAGSSTVQSSARNYLPGPPDCVEYVRTFRFAEGQATGVLAEVGAAWSTSGATLFSRELIRDGEGNPTTFTVLPDESLDVVYRLRLYPPQTDVLGTFTLTPPGQSFDFTLRPAQMPSEWPVDLLGSGFTGTPFASAFQTQTLGPRTGGPGGSQSNSSSTSRSAYVAGSYYSDVTVTFGLTAGNFAGGIGAIIVRGGYTGAGATLAAFQASFDPKIPKDGTKILNLNYRVSWARRP